eukprot:COSAG06_NODE_1096_length_10720_cov_195.594521_13_plen_240_part_00
MMMRPPVGEAKNERRGRLGHRLSPRSAKHSPKELMSATEDVSFENPLETGSSEPGALAELDIEATLKAGTLTEAQAIVQMERKMQAQVDAKIAELEERLGGGGQAAPATEVAIHSLIAHLTESPSNWHQDVVFGLVSDDPADAELRRWAPLGYVVSGVIVFMQSVVAVVLYAGTMWPACANKDQCVVGTYCGYGVFSGRCTFCGESMPLAITSSGQQLVCCSGLAISRARVRVGWRPGR